MSAPPVRIAAVGCGRVAQHYRSILDSGVVSGWQMVGVCDRSAERGETFAGHFGAPAYTDYEQMLARSRPDLVLVLTPSNLHYEQARIALGHGMHVLVEKPIAMLPAQARELDALATREGLMYGVAFQNRFNPAIRLLREAMMAGRFGRIVMASVRLHWCRYQAYYEDDWHGTWEKDGGVINQQAIHHVDALNWLAGPVESVCARSGNRLNRLEAEDTLVAAVRFENGALGTIEATTAARPEDIEASLTVIGERGMASIGGIALNRVDTWQFVDALPEDPDAPRIHSCDVPTGYGLSHGPLLQQVIDTLQSGRGDAPVSAREGIATTELVHALYHSDETGRWVDLADRPISARLGTRPA